MPEHHIGRSFPGLTPDIETACPCPKAACGLVIREQVTKKCREHHVSAAKTIRQTHTADQCPGVPQPEDPAAVALAPLEAAVRAERRAQQTGDRAALRDRIADAVRDVQLHIDPMTRILVAQGEPIILSRDEADAVADVVLAVLPEPTDQAAAEPPLSPYYEHPECGFHWHGRDGMDIPIRDGQPVCPRCELHDQAAVLDRLRATVHHLAAHAVGFQDVLDESDRGPWGKTVGADIAELRRLADEQPTTPTEAHPPEHRWAAELYDPTADEWVPGTRFPARDRAVAALEHGRRIGATWKDGTPTQRRLVRETKTYTVEPAPAGPAAPTKETEGRCPACGHTVCDGDGPCGARSGNDFCICTGAAPAKEAPLCGKTRSFDGATYRPCSLPAGHPEAYCQSADGDRLFLAAPPMDPVHILGIDADEQQPVARPDGPDDTPPATR